MHYEKLFMEIILYSWPFAFLIFSYLGYKKESFDLFLVGLGYPIIVLLVFPMSVVFIICATVPYGMYLLMNTIFKSFKKG